MTESEIRSQIQSRANALLRAATRADAEERNRDVALVIYEIADQLRPLAGKLYAHPDQSERTEVDSSAHQLSLSGHMSHRDSPLSFKGLLKR